ncbi:MAG: GNAT family N-acetyltransferase [Ignavibacteria bacterium]|nr:GNAT family N-acetyltransferase [Ignavibacteria bacterium]
MEFRELSGQRIRLINLNIEYLHDIHEYSIMPQFYDHLEYPPFKDLEETRAFLTKLFKRSDEISGHYWFIYNISEEKVIGTIGLLDIDRRKGSAELAYGLSPNYWGRGFFSEALILVIDWYFSLDSTHRLFIKTAEKNINSIKAAKKLGFKMEGVLRGYYLDDKTSQRWDAALLSMLRTDIIN